MQLKVSLDTTEFVKAAVEEVEHTLVEAVILVLIVVFVFLGNFRATFIPMLAVPVSLVGTFAAFGMLGFSINTLTLFGIVLAIGIVVDDAIVVVEAVEHHIEKGLDPLAATEKAMEEVSGPVIAIALVLCAVFVPVAFMGGITGQLYRQFAVTLSISVLLSAFVALTLTPALCVMILRHRKEMRGPIGWFIRGFNKVFNATTTGYAAIVGKLVRLPIVGLAAVGGVIFVVVTLVGILPKSFVPTEDQGYLFVPMTLPDGASMERTEQLADRATDAIRKLPGVAEVVTMGGMSILTGAYTSNNATLIVLFKPWHERTTPESSLAGITKAIRALVATYPEAIVLAIEPPPIPGLGSAGGFQFELEDRAGNSADALAETADKFLAAARQRPELVGLFNSFRTTVPQIKLDIDRDKVKTLGVPLNSVFEALQTYLGGLQVNDFNLFGRIYKVSIQAEPRFRVGPENINNIYVRAADDSMVPLSTISKIGSTTGSDTISRYNMYRSADIMGANAPGYSSGQALTVMEDIAKESLPQGYGYEWTTTAYQERQAGTAQAVILALGLIFVFLFLAAQYESWGIPFSVILGIPVGVMGAFLVVWIRDFVNDTYVQIGLVTLVGLAAKNAILIVEFAKMKREEGVPLLEAAIEGSRLRFRPILMTSFAFILGVVPLMVATGAGSASRQSLGTAVFGGMTAATCIGVFLIPTLYVVVQGLTERFFGAPKPKNAAAAAHGAPSNGPGGDESGAAPAAAGGHA